MGRNDRARTLVHNGDNRILGNRAPTFRISTQYSSFGFFEAAGAKFCEDTSGKFRRLIGDCAVFEAAEPENPMPEPSVHESKRSGLGPGGWFVVVALGVMLGA